MHEYFATRRGGANGQTLVPESDQNRAFDLAARVLTMTNVVGADGQDLFNQTDSGEEGGIGSLLPAVWTPTRCLQDSMTDFFPSRIHPSLQAGDAQAGVIKKSLTAEMLRKVAGIKIEPTDNLRDHLKFDSTAGVALVFHHTSVLKEHLLATKETEGDEV